MSSLGLREVKCESVCGYIVLSSAFMDDEEDLLTWSDLNYPAPAFNAAELAPEPESSPNQDPLSIPGRKRPVWESESSQPNKRVAQNPEQTDTENKTRTESEKINHPPDTDSAESSLPLWQNDTIESVPAAFDNSLSCLGSSSYNLNETLLSSPSLTVFKQEGNGDGTESDPDGGSTLQRLLQVSSYLSRSDQDCRFQYVLAAATSIASKEGEETLTYLNQGQSYGIKLKKVGELLGFKGKLLKSVVRLQFHERRLQYSEKEQILAWQASRPGERIVELDVPLSYGLFDVEHDDTMVNTLSFCWDPTVEVGAYIKVNSISTEFTPKKHGGEKGVPFRIQVETYIQGDSYRLHAAACQIRVFKLKGADRKHKQEREKWLKLPECERAKYQPPFESTILSDLSPEAIMPPQPYVNNVEPPAFRMLPSPRLPSVNVPTAARPGRPHGLPSNLPDVPDIATKMEEATVPPAPIAAPLALQDKSASQFSVEMDREQVCAWLIHNGFEMLSGTFGHFNGTDMMRLTRQDLIAMCGLPNGTRLHYALRCKPAIRLTLFVNLPGKDWYHAVYLQTTNVSELTAKLAALLNITGQIPVSNLYMAGPNGIHVYVTDELLGNIQNEGSFSLHVHKDAERCCLLLRPTTG